MSLRRRVLVGIVAVAAVLVVTNVVLWSTFHSFLLERVDRQLEDVVGRGVRADRRGVRFPVPDQETLTEYYIAVASLETGQVRRLRSTLVGDRTPPPVIRVDELKARAAPTVSLAEPFTVPAASGDGSWRLLAVRNQQGTVAIIGANLAELDATLDRMRVVQIGGTAAVLLALAVMSLWVLRLGVDPVESMARTADAIAAGDLWHRVEHTDERTEAGRLGIALNSMLTRIEQTVRALEQSEAKVRRFAADASHELRTPLTSIRGYAELWRAGGLRAEDELADAMRRMEQEATRMATLVDDLLLLARLDQRRPLERTRVPLDDIASDGVRDARAVEPDRPIELVTEPVEVDGDEMQLRQVVANLLANTRMHTPAGTPVRVAVQRRDGLARVEVADTGPGMEPRVADKVFERFFRADPSRARSAGGSGLGLSIVAAIAEAHGGTAAVESQPGRGTRFIVELPAASPPPPADSGDLGPRSSTLEA